MSIKSKIESLIASGNATTGESDADLTSVMQTLVDGYGQGGGEIHNQDKTVVPSESVQSITADDGYTGLGEVTVDGIPTDYVGSEVPRKSSADLTVSGATVNVPSGYYSASASKSVPSGSEGTPVATKGAVSNHAVDVTPSVTNTEGYIAGGTKNGTAVNVFASELVSGTKSITANGTEDVTNYASVNVNVPNSYSASDEGKVVSNGALVAQGSQTITENGTYDTTLVDDVTVNVASSGGWTIDDIATKEQPSGDIVISVPRAPGYNARGVRDYAFYKNGAITSITVTTNCNIYANAFASMPNLERFSAPILEQLGNLGISSSQYVFQNDTKLKYVYIPKVSGLGTQCFQGCTALEILDFPSLTSIGANYTFRNCSNLKHLVLRKSSVVSTNTNSYQATPFASNGTGGTLWVPEDLIASYQSATNWSTILGYENNQIKSIESSATDPDAPIDLTQYYGDGTPIE